MWDPVLDALLFNPIFQPQPPITMPRLAILCLLLAACLAGCSPPEATQERSPSAESPRPVIFDTDIGSDIDDTWALAYLLQCPELDLKLVTTATANTEYRARLAAKFLEVAKRTDVPVGMGPTGESYHQYQAPWIEGYQLSDYPGTVFEDGVDRMIEMIHASTEPITIIAVGPATNIGEALKRDPSIAPKTHFVGMYGSVDMGYGEGSEPTAEANVRGNVEAFRAVLEAPWLSCRLTPLDTCGLVVLEGDLYRSIYTSELPMIEALVENYDIWARLVTWVEIERPDLASSTLFDTVAIYIAYSDQFLEYERTGLSVSDEGITIRDPNARPVDVAIRWKDLDAFEAHLTNRLLQQ